MEKEVSTNCTAYDIYFAKCSKTEYNKSNHLRFKCEQFKAKYKK